MQIFMTIVKKNTSKTKKLKSLIRHQKLKISHKLCGFPYKQFFKSFFLIQSFWDQINT